MPESDGRESGQQRADRIERTRQHAEQMEAEARAEHAKAEQRIGIDHEVETELQIVRPHADAPSRAGVTPDGSGADGQRG